MKLTEEDLSARTNQRVHLDTWLFVSEWEQILENQEIVERLREAVIKDGLGDCSKCYPFWHWLSEKHQSILENK